MRSCPFGQTGAGRLDRRWTRSLCARFAFVGCSCRSKPGEALARRNFSGRGSASASLQPRQIENTPRDTSTQAST